MTSLSRPFALIAALAIGTPASGADRAEPLSREQLLADPGVAGTLAVIDAWLAATRLYDRVPGMSVGIVRDQDLLWHRGYGFSNLETQRPADADTLYSICSISKLFTAVGIMQLRDEGRLELRDAVGDHLEWFDVQQAHQGSAPITIESLLTHSSGLPREAADLPYWNGPDFPFPTREQVIERLGSQQTLYPAQYHFQYSNLALTLAGEVIQARSGRPYGAYIQERILDPLGLRSTRSEYPEDLRGDSLAIGYTGVHRDGRRDPVAPFFTRALTPAAGFTSSVTDLARFASWQFRLLARGGTEVLDANTLREMHRVHWVDPDWKTTWGVGFEVRRSGDVTIVGHGGGCPGYITNFSMVPKQRIAVVVLTNAGDGPAGRLASNILGVIGPAVEAAATPAGEQAPDWSKYEGNYESRPWGGEIAVRQRGDELVVIDLPADDLKKALTRLAHDGGDAFVRLTDDDERREPWRFQLDAGGRAHRIVRHGTHLDRIE